MSDLSILTSADLEAIRAALSSWYRSLGEEEIRRHTAEIAFKVDRFSKPEYGGAQPKQVQWMIQGLCWLDHYKFDFLWELRERELLTVADLKSRVAEKAQMDLVDAMEDYEDDAGDWLVRHPDQNKPSDENHPWGKEDLQVFQAWLNSTPYTVWAMYNTVLEDARYELEESLLSFSAGGDHGESFTRSIREGYARLMKQWETKVRANYDQKLLAEHKARQNDAC
jgi:hypothetical protein